MFAKRLEEKRNKRTIEKLLHTLRILIGHDNWCIAGSYAALQIKSPNDIDVFFHTEEDCVAGLASAYAVDPGAKDTEYETNNAVSMYFDSISLPVQFIRKHFGKAEEVIDTFDLNICKRAILPDGTSIACPSAYEELHISNVTASTFTRYFKYIGRLGKEKDIPTLGKTIIDTYIGDSTMVEDYYNENRPTLPTNLAMFETVCAFSTIKDYAYEQAAIHAPELLI